MVFIGIALLFIGVIVAFVIFKYFKKFPIVKKTITFLANKILFNTFIRTFIAGYLVFALSSFKNVKNLIFTSAGDVFSSILALILTSLCVASPVAIYIFLLKYQSLLNTDRFKNRCHSLYVGVNTNRFESVISNVFFITRRLFIAAVIVFASFFPAL